MYKFVNAHLCLSPFFRVVELSYYAVTDLT